MRLIIGLGNPGIKYQGTRHNIGFMVVDKITADFNFKSIFNAEISKKIFRDQKIIIVKPQTFMNLSGDAVMPIMGFYKLSPSDLVVIHDDIDMEFGKIRVSLDQGHGGHNGVRSIIDSLGTSEFYRIRIGVGRHLRL